MQRRFESCCDHCTPSTLRFLELEKKRTRSHVHISMLRYIGAQNEPLSGIVYFRHILCERIVPQFVIRRYCPCSSATEALNNTTKNKYPLFIIHLCISCMRDIFSTLYMPLRNETNGKGEGQSLVYEFEKV